MDPIFMRLPARADDGLVNVVIDTPKGSRNKYKFEEETAIFRLSRILPAGMAFPHDFGSIPQTRAEDGDPLDVMVITPSPSFVGCLIKVRLIGTIRGKQTEKGETVRNDRLLAVPVTKVNGPDFEHVDELPPGWVDEFKNFFVAYNAAQGRKYEPTGVGGPRRAKAALVKAERMFRNSKG